MLYSMRSDFYLFFFFEANAIAAAAAIAVTGTAIPATPVLGLSDLLPDVLFFVVVDFEPAGFAVVVVVVVAALVLLTESVVEGVLVSPGINVNSRLFLYPFAVTVIL